MAKKKLSRLAKAKADPNSRYWRNKALQQWSIFVRRRDNGCVVCGKKEDNDAHHLIAATNEATRFETNNGISACKKHHKFGTDISFHKQSVVAFLHMVLNRKWQVCWISDHIHKPVTETAEQAYLRLLKLNEENQNVAQTSSNGEDNIN